MLSYALLFMVESAVSPALPTPEDYREDARSIEPLINDTYAYPERLSGKKFVLSPKLKAEAEQVDDKRELLSFAERALATLADHHAITGSSGRDSWAVVPSYSDVWIEKIGVDYVVDAVREGSPAQAAGVKKGDRLVAVAGLAIQAAVDAYWTDLGVESRDRNWDSYAARVLAAGRRASERTLSIAPAQGPVRELKLPTMYFLALVDRPVLQKSEAGGSLTVRFNDSLGYDATISAFDSIMAAAKPRQPVILDLTDTPSGGNTTVARAIMSWFVTRPSFYQVHQLPAEQRRTGIARQWVEQVLPRQGKRHLGKVAVKVGRWTGSMGEGLAIGLDALGATVNGTRMAGLLGAVYDYRLPNSGLVLKLPTERLSHVDGTPREAFVPRDR